MVRVPNRAMGAAKSASALLLAAVLAAQVPAQEPTSRQQAMAQLALQLQDVQRQIETQRSGNGDEAKLAALRDRQRTLTGEFASVATGFDVARIEHPVEQQYDLQAELMRVLRPLVRALSRATEAPRQSQELQEHLDAVGARLEQALQVQRGFDRARTEAAAGTDARVQEQLRAAIERWNAFVADLQSDQLVTRGRLDAIEAGRTPVTQTVQNAVAGFFRQSGLSLLLAAVVGVGVLLLLRSLHRRLMRAAGGRPLRLSVRMLDVALQVLAGLAAMAAVLLVFYLRGDFELLALAIVFLLGLGWAASRTLPLFVEQLRLLLNTGAVREGERIVVDGLPYRVEALALQTRLVNPDLQGGVLRMPLRDLVGRASRPFAPQEAWFPSRVGDWVRLRDGTIGCVELQSPEQVVVLVEQTRRTFRAADFLAQDPANLSAGFQLVVPFGIDYALQRASTGDVPARMAEALRQRLPDVDGGRHVELVLVEFAQAGASALEYEVRVQCAGAAAPQYGVLRRAIARILVDACSQHGWLIPFPQLTLHRAD